MESARNAVVHFDVDLGQGVALVNAGVLEVRPGRHVHNVANIQPLDSLVLGDAPTAVVAAYNANMTAVVLSSTVVTSLGGHGLGRCAMFRTKRLRDPPKIDNNPIRFVSISQSVD